jgi:hypothetical protein
MVILWNDRLYCSSVSASLHSWNFCHFLPVCPYIYFTSDALSVFLFIVCPVATSRVLLSRCTKPQVLRPQSNLGSPLLLFSVYHNEPVDGRILLVRKSPSYSLPSLEILSTYRQQSEEPLFNIRTTWVKHRTSAQLQVKLSFLRSNALLTRRSAFFSFCFSASLSVFPFLYLQRECVTLQKLRQKPRLVNRDRIPNFIIIWLCECQLEEGGDVGTDECTCGACGLL